MSDYALNQQIEKEVHSFNQSFNFLYDFNNFQRSDYISSSDLDIANKTRSNQLPWKGQFSPQLIEAILKKFVKNSTEVILDPFLGSGTVILEASKFGLSSIGSEINPAAHYLASLYKLINLKERLPILEALDKKIDKIISNTYPLFNCNTDREDLEKRISETVQVVNTDEEKVIIKGFIILLDYHSKKVTPDYVNKTWNRLKKIILEMPYSDKPIQIFNCDARTIPIKSGSVDLVVTSPPYINVFNYHQQYRSSVESLGWNLLHVAKSEIGSNRKHRSNRFLTVIQYILDMYYVFNELARVTKNDSDIIFIIGRESNVRKTRFLNSEIVASVGVLAGFRKPTWQERKYINRFGQTIFEDIIYFKDRDLLNIDEKKCRELAREVLTKSLPEAPKESISDLLEAIKSHESVLHSQLYQEHDELLRRGKDSVGLG